MPKILFISNFLNCGGWSVAAERHMRAISQIAEVVPRHVNLGNGRRDIQIGSQDLDGCATCIQHVLPNFAEPDHRFQKNILAFYSETDSLCSTWARAINRFDEIVVSSPLMEDMLWSYTDKPIHVIPIPLDIEAINTTPPNDYGLREAFPNDIFFYAFVDKNYRKNIADLLTAFHTEFAPHEHVQLVLKLPGTQEQDREWIEALCAQVKQSLRLYRNASRYKNEIKIYGYGKDEVLYGLHKAMDVYVNTSFGEAYSIPTMEALAAGKLCVVPDYLEAVKPLPNFYRVETHKMPCQFSNAPEGVQTAHENWWRVDIVKLRDVMRLMNDLTEKSFEKPNMEAYSYGAVAKQWENLL